MLTAVPRFKEGSTRVLRESFQSLRTALLLAARSEGCQIVMVTSATPSEGKTTVSFNLARVLASGGERVLLIDGDLRRPRLHRLVSSKNVRGLTSVVLGEREVRDVITALADVPNLDVVTSGPLPPNPPELFGKTSFTAMLEKVRQDYDWVVIDTPPVASVTDAVICSRVVDMAVFVVQYGGPKRQDGPRGPQEPAPLGRPHPGCGHQPGRRRAQLLLLLVVLQLPLLHLGPRAGVGARNPEHRMKNRSGSRQGS